MNLKRLTIIILFPLLKACYFIFGLVPRNKNLWVFGSYQDTFSDNSKYLFTHIVESEPEVQAVWISANRDVISKIRAAGGNAYYRWSLSGLWHSSRGKYWFISSYVADINYYLSRGACIINLWHGVPLKKIEFDIDKGPLAQRYQNPGFLDRHIFTASAYRRPDYVLSTSDSVSCTSFSSAFRIPQESCLALGYPRLDIFSWSYQRRLEWVKRWGAPSLIELMERARAYRKVLVYMPTWRDANPNFITQVGIDFQIFNQKLHDEQMLLVLKLHVNTPPKALDALSGLSNIVLMNPRDDIYPFLPQTHGLITDYSSVYIDYLLLDRPIFFFAFDMEKYLGDSRGFYYSYESVTPGAVIKNGTELFNHLFSPEDEPYAFKRSELRENLFNALTITPGTASLSITGRVKDS